VNLGTSGLVLATPEPCHGDLLPWCDHTWKEGEIGINQPLFSSTLLPIPSLGSFISACQATHVLGSVLKHRNDYKTLQDRAFCLSEAIQLHGLADALDSSIQIYLDSPSNHDNGAAVVAAAICYSAQLILYGLYGCNEPDELEQPRLAKETEMQQTALEGIKKVSIHRVRQLAQYAHGANTSFLICYCLYHAASECAWFIREYEEPAMVECLRTYVEVLTEMNGRWKVAGLYLQLLERERVLEA
jgi:hypothetical protein